MVPANRMIGSGRDRAAFLHSGVKRPHQMGRSTPVGAPSCSDFRSFVGARTPFEPVRHPDSRLQRDIPGRPDVAATQAEEKKDIRSPGADAADRGELGARFWLRHVAQ